MSRQAARSLWSSEAMEDDDLDQVPSLEMDDDGAASISPVSSEECLDDITDLEGFAIANEPEAAPEKDICREEAADSVLAWSALAALLGSPAPPCIARKKPRSLERNLWDDGHAAGEDLEDLLLHDPDQAPSIEIDDNSVASISPVSSEECLDDITDLEEFAIANEANAAPERDIGRAEAADSVLAWSALAALLGSPAPPCVVGKKPRSPEMNLWDDGHAADEDLDNLLLPAQDPDSHPDSDKKNNTKSQPFAPKGFGEEDDTPSAPSLLSTFDDDDDSQRSPRTVARLYDDVLATQARGTSHNALMVPL